MRRARARVNAGIRSRFVIVISALVALVILVQTAVLVYFARHRVRDEIENRAGAYAELAVVPICQAYSKYSESGLSKFYGIVHDTAELDPDLRALAIYSTAGEVVFHSDDLEAAGAAAARRPGPGARRVDRDLRRRRDLLRRAGAAHRRVGRRALRRGLLLLL